MRVRTLPRATFHTTATGRLRLLETGDELELASVAPAVPAELLEADATPYRGLLEVRPAEAATLTVVNVVNLEDYLRGVVPNELSPQAFPQIEALKAQAVAARTYALSHLGDYCLEGLRRLRDARLPGLPGAVHRSTPSPTARSRRRGGSWPPGGAGRSTRSTRRPAGDTPRTATRSSTTTPPTCAGWPASRSSRRALRVRTTSAPRRDLPGGPETAHDVALLEALGRDRRSRRGARRGSRASPTDAEVRAWTGRLQAALHRSGCDSPVERLPRPPRHVRPVPRGAPRAGASGPSACLAPGDAEYLSQVEDTGQPRTEGERQALALLVHEGAGLAGGGQHAAPRRRADPGRRARASSRASPRRRAPPAWRRASSPGSPRGP